MPEFSMKDLNGNVVSSKDLEGKKVHVNFWSTACKPCIMEFPDLNELKESNPGEEFVFITFAPESAQKISALLDKKPLNYIVIPDAAEYLDLLGISTYPTNYFVNSNGEIEEVIEGARFEVEMVDGKEVFKPANLEIYQKALEGLE